MSLRPGLFFLLTVLSITVALTAFSVLCGSTLAGPSPARAKTASEIDLAGMESTRTRIMPGVWGRPTVIADTGGKISRVILQFSTPYLSDVVSVFHDFLTGIDSDTSVVIACADAAEQEFLDRTIREWNIPNPSRIWLVNVNREITIWSRDRYLAFDSEPGSSRGAFILPKDDCEEDEDRRNDREVPLLVGSAMGELPDWEISDLIFEGGDIVATDTHLFVGENTILSQETLSPEAAVRSLMALTGKEVVVVGNSPSSALDGHIDLFLTPLDDTSLLLGDPIEGLRVLSGDPVGRDKLGEVGIFISANQIVPIAEAYEGVRAALEQKGFKVNRVPIFHGVDSEGDNFKMTYNNVIMEDLGQSRRVFLPRYGVSAIDDAAGRVYETLGFRVSRVDVSRVYLLGGTLRCMVNVVRRTPSVKRAFRLPRLRLN